MEFAASQGSSSLATILKSIAPEISAQIVLAPTRQMAGQINFASGKRVYFRGSSLDINPHGSAQIARDKNNAAFFMRRMGFRAVKGNAFFSKEWAEQLGSSRDPEAAVLFARRAGYPLVVKPNSGSRGRGVHVVTGESDFREAMSECFALDPLILVQPLVEGREYRVVVVGSEVIFAYERRPPSVVGDGRSTIEDLLARKQDVWRSEARPVQVRRDRWVAACLHRRGHDFATVPSAGERIPLLDQANLSAGGEAVDVTGQIGGPLERLCIEVTCQMGLRFCGLDLIVASDGSGDVESAHILEINASPRMGHYASLGPAQYERVRDLYRKVLRQLEQIP